MVAGGAAGAIASAFTTPLDVVKTLLNTQETGAGVTRGMKEAIIQVKKLCRLFQKNISKLQVKVKKNTYCHITASASKYQTHQLQAKETKKFYKTNTSKHYAVHCAV